MPPRPPLFRRLCLFSLFLFVPLSFFFTPLSILHSFYLSFFLSLPLFQSISDSLSLCLSLSLTFSLFVSLFFFLSLFLCLSLFSVTIFICVYASLSPSHLSLFSLSLFTLSVTLFVYHPSPLSIPFSFSFSFVRDLATEWMLALFSTVFSFNMHRRFW